MKEIHQVEELQEWIRQEQQAGCNRVLVPTMGGLHEGHLSLVDIAREQAAEGETVALSLFVNPTQFGPGEDLDAYPRTLERDRQLCEERGVDLLFVPDADEMYEEDASVRVSEQTLSQGMCGRSRPGHFDGVCTVVSKLFNLFCPRVAVFGEKDFQQLAVIRRMVRDMNYAIEIIGGPIVREEDGLAMSTRNQYLDEEERQQAVCLNQALNQAGQSLDDGERDAGRIREQLRQAIESASLARIDYVETVDPDTLQEVGEVEKSLLMALAVFFGETRLIDNLCWREEE